MAQLFTAPTLQALNSSGTPYSGAKLNFYQTGTTTPITIYQDDDATTPHANPVVADASGRFAAIYVNTATFKVVLTDADDVTIQTVDPVNINAETLFNVSSIIDDDKFILVDPADNTKRVRIDAGNVSAGQTRVLSAPNFDSPLGWIKGADITPSAGVLTLGAGANYFDVTGTNAITSIASVGVGMRVLLQFDDELTLTHSTDLVLRQSQNIKTTAGDHAEFVEYASGDWRLVDYYRAAGVGTSAWVDRGLATTTSGTSQDFTAIPPWASEIEIIFNNVSTNGTSALRVQLGDSGGFETSGYDGAIGVLTASPTYTSVTDGVGLPTVAANGARYGVLRFSRFNAGSNGWGYECMIVDTANSVMGISTGFKVLSDALTQVRLTTAGGTDTFDTGTAYLKYR